VHEEANYFSHIVCVFMEPAAWAAEHTMLRQGERAAGAHPRPLGKHRALPEEIPNAAHVCCCPWLAL
jgi:hypothetical protein